MSVGVRVHVNVYLPSCSLQTLATLEWSRLPIYICLVSVNVYSLLLLPLPLIHSRYLYFPGKKAELFIIQAKFFKQFSL